MTDKINEQSGKDIPPLGKIPYGSGGGGDDDFEYRFDKKDKIILICLICLIPVIVFQYYQLQDSIKHTDWNLDPNYNWTCADLTKYQKSMETIFKTSGIDIPNQLLNSINEKKKELDCKI